MSDFILGAIVGFLGAVLLLYWQQIKFVAQNAGTFSDVNNIVQSSQNLLQKI